MCIEPQPNEPPHGVGRNGGDGNGSNFGNATRRRPARTHLLDDEAVGDDFFFVKGARQCPRRQQTTGGNAGTVDRGHFKLSSNTIHALRRRDRGPQRAAGASVVGRAPAQAASSAAPGGAAAGVKDGGAVERDAAPGTRGS